MIWKISLYLLFIGLPAAVVTSMVEENTNDNGAQDIAMVHHSEATDGAKDFELVEKEEAPSDGAILGSVITEKPAADVQISATNGSETITGTVESNGEFFINGFEKGTYTVSIVTKNENGAPDNIEVFNDVEIGIGEVTALGTVNFDK